jgi:predicted metal-dependent peptidase
MTTTSTASKTVKGPVEVDPKVDAMVVDKLVSARIRLLLKQPFYGNLATRLQLVNADAWCPTAATDGRRFYYNTQFINLLSPKELEFLFGHEVLHVVYDHMGRRDTRDPQLWNVAADYCVNADLIQQRIGERITKVPVLYDSKYDGMTSEEVYDDLFKNAKKINLNQLIKQVLDDHMDPEGSDGDGDGDKKDGGNGRPKISAEEQKQIRDEIKEAVLSAAQICGAGSIPSGVKRLIDSLTMPQMNWRELLAQQIQSTIKSDFTWMRPSRKGWHNSAIMPGMKPGEMIDICVAIDMSGSVSEAQLRDFFGEVTGIMSQYDDYRIHLWTFDTEVYNPQVFTQDNLSDMMNYEPQGGGGTMFECNWEWMKENGIEPKKLVFFTDGYPCGSWGDENYCDTVFIIHGPKEIEPPFGVWAHYDDHRN